MKISKYNKILTLENGKKIIFNSMSCALTEANDDFLKVLNKIDLIKYEELEERKKELLDKMLLDNYIIQDYVDEMKLIKYKHFSAKYDKESINVTIAPTLMCNFECPYCFETPQKWIMKEDVIEGILNILSEAIKRGKNIRLVWYGGEPLIAIDVIYKISNRIIQMCDNNDTRISAFLVTNGYLLTDEIIKKLKICRVTGAQITLDGPPDVHNSRRKLKGNNDGTFDVILNNIKRMGDNGITPSIRINIDKTNTNRVEELLDILARNGLKSFPVDFGQISSLTEACASISETCLNTREYAAQTLNYQNILHNHGFDILTTSYYPRTRTNYCIAHSVSSIIIDPRGFMYKCWNDIGNEDKAVGNVVRSEDTIPDEKMYFRNIEHILKSPFNYKECIDCFLLPICMGGCPYNEGMLEETPNCEPWKYNLDDVLKLTYLQKGNISRDTAMRTDYI